MYREHFSEGVVPTVERHVLLSDVCAAATVAVLSTAAAGNEASQAEVVAPAEAGARVDAFRETVFKEIRSTCTSELAMFVDGLEDLARTETPIAWTPAGPCLRSVLALLGSRVSDEAEFGAMQVVLLRVGHLLTPAPGRGGRMPTFAEIRETTFIGVLRTKLDALPVGTAVARHGASDRVSWKGLAIMLDIDRVTLLTNKQAREEVSARLADGRLVLGQPYLDASTSGKARVGHRDSLIRIIRAHRDGPEPGPIPIEPGPRRKYARDVLMDLAEVPEGAMRTALWGDPKVRAVLSEVAAAVGTARPGDPPPRRTPVLTFSELSERLRQDARDAFLGRNPTAEAAKVAKAVANELVPLNRCLRLNGWTADQDVGELLLGQGGEAAVAKGFTGSRADAAYGAAMSRAVSRATAMVDARREKVSFSDRIRELLKRRKVSAVTISRRSGVPYDTFLRWRNGNGVPSFEQIHLVHRLEREFGLAKDALVATLGVVRQSRNTSGRKTVTLADGRTVQLKHYLRFLPAGAIDWPEDRLAQSVAEADVRHYGSCRANSVRQKAVGALVRTRQKLGADVPIIAEFERLSHFKVDLNDAKRELSPRSNWGSSKTIKNARNHTREFAQFCLLPRDQGGLGLHAGQVSFILFLNPAVVQKYVFYRALRFSRLTIDGKALGTMLGGSEFGFLGFVKGLLDVQFGWFVQCREDVAAPSVVDVDFPLEKMTCVDKEFTIAMPTEPVICKVMDDALVHRLRTDWTGAVLHARRMVSSLAGKVGSHYKMIRNPHELIMPILVHDSPIAVVVRQVAEALKRARPIEVCPVQHAKDYRNAVAMLLLVTVAFRSETLRDLEWRPDGTGNLIRTPEGYDVVVEAERFKNGFCKWLFGPSFRRRDYERALGDWGDLTAIIDYYVKTCRPLLLKGRTSDLLFPTAQTTTEKWTEPTFNKMITDWTRTWSVANMRYGTGLPGVLPWGPHCIRDIVATHIVRHCPGEERWTIASGILGASVEVVKEHYAFVHAKRELAKADGIMAEAFAAGFGSALL